MGHTWVAPASICLWETIVMQVKIIRATVAKQSTAQARDLAAQFKAELKPGNYDIVKWEYAPNGHLRVTFANKVGNFQTWLLWGDDIVPDNQGKRIQLKVPYYSQRDNQSSEWWRQCN